MLRAGRACLATATALLGWHLVVLLTGAPSFILPGPLDVAQALGKNAALLVTQTGFSAVNLLQGLALGVVLGVATALNLALSPAARLFLRPVLIFAQAVPVFALAPVITLWLGYGAPSKIVMVALVTYFPIASAFFDGLMRLPPGLSDLAQTSGAGPLRQLIHLQVPNALPALASGLRLSAIYAPLAVVIGEWVGSSRGLGHLMLMANGRGQTDLMFASLMVLALLSLSLWALVEAVARRYLTR
ncbi:ABC transporter permease [Pontibaca sp. S1109L]|uniref:ABC transporter permease n=2 Tax=Pontibaca salina TaxID=2795731 RepID=A0A934HU28_9RHOB|nr:ABC transporter permease [Pontibaca salina]